MNACGRLLAELNLTYTTVDVCSTALASLLTIHLGIETNVTYTPGYGVCADIGGGFVPLTYPLLDTVMDMSSEDAIQYIRDRSI